MGPPPELGSKAERDADLPLPVISVKGGADVLASTAINSEEAGWTTQTLKIYIDSLIDERDQRYEQRFEAQEKAVLKAEKAQKERNLQQNEIRGQLNDQNKAFVNSLGNLVPRKEFESQYYRLSERTDELRENVQKLRESRSEQEGSSAASIRAWGIVIGFVVVVVNVVVYLLGRK